MQSTICFFIGMAMMACAIVGYACIRVGAMSEREEMLAEGKREPWAAFGKKRVCKTSGWKLVNLWLVAVESKSTHPTIFLTAGAAIIQPLI